jgi:hypothetical protein
MSRQTRLISHAKKNAPGEWKAHKKMVGIKMDDKQCKPLTVWMRISQRPLQPPPRLPLSLQIALGLIPLGLQIIQPREQLLSRSST